MAATASDAVIKTKLVVLFAPGDSASPAELSDALRAERDRLKGALGEGFDVRAATAVDMTTVKASMSADERAGYGSGTPYTGMLWVAAPAGRIEEITAAAEGLADRLGQVIAAERSAAIAGNEETSIPGDGPIVSMFSILRPAGVSYADCHDFWR